MRLRMRLFATTKDGHISRRFHKFRYTAALRLGIVPSAPNGFVEFEFMGDITDTVVAHKNNVPLLGSLVVNSQVFENVILIAKPLESGHMGFITFWPVS